MAGPSVRAVATRSCGPTLLTGNAAGDGQPVAEHGRGAIHHPSCGLNCLPAPRSVTGRVPSLTHRVLVVDRGNRDRTPLSLPRSGEPGKECPSVFGEVGEEVGRPHYVIDEFKCIRSASRISTRCSSGGSQTAQSPGQRHPEAAANPATCRSRCFDPQEAMREPHVRGQ